MYGFGETITIVSPGHTQAAKGGRACVFVSAVKTFRTSYAILKKSLTADEIKNAQK